MSWMRDDLEERLGDRCRCIWMTERYKVCMLGEAIHHSQDDALDMNMWQAFDEVERDV
jgi:hypothetical protein